MSGVLVLDAGSSALKAVLFGRDGAVLAEAQAGYGSPPAPHRQHAAAWWTAAGEAARAVAPAGVPEAIALTGTMENLVAVDAAGEALAPAMTYPDPAGAPYLEAWAGRLEALGATAILGNPPEPLMSAFKLMALRSEEPEAAGAAWFLPGAKDVLALRLAGAAATDAVTASTAGLMDLAVRGWSEVLCGALSIDTARLPAIRRADAVLGPLVEVAAAHLGVPAGLPVVNGCGDAGATTLGSFCDAPGDVSLYLGTSGWVARVVPAASVPEPRPVYRLAHPADEALLIEVSPLMSAGAATGWLRGVLDLTVAEAEAHAAAVDERPPDLLFLPYLAGERFPFNDLAVRGAFLGLDSGHGAGHLAHAALEGIAFAIRANLEALDAAPGAITLVGGGAESTLWPQLVADALGRPVGVAPAPTLATALGAFRLAVAALGWEEPAAALPRLVAPRPDRRERVERLYGAFRQGTDFVRSLAGALQPRAPR